MVRLGYMLTEILSCLREQMNGQRPKQMIYLRKKIEPYVCQRRKWRRRQIFVWDWTCTMIRQRAMWQTLTVAVWCRMLGSRQPAWCTNMFGRCQVSNAMRGGIFLNNFHICFIKLRERAVTPLVEAICYKPQGHGFKFRRCGFLQFT
jgi:hypothetical protein